MREYIIFPSSHISFDSKTRLKILYIMDFQKKREGGPPYTTAFLTYCQTFLLFPHRSRCSSSIWETTLFSLFFSYLLLCQSQGHSTLFLQYFDASSLSHGANKRKAALNAHISYQFFVDPKKGYGIKDFGYQVFIAFFLVQNGLKVQSNMVWTCKKRIFYTYYLKGHWSIVSLIVLESFLFHCMSS